MPSPAKKRFSLAEQLRNEYEIESSLKAVGAFSEEPVPLDVFIKDKKFLAQSHITLSDSQYSFIRHMEQVYLPETYPFMVENFGEYWTPERFVNLLILQWGKGGGKDLVAQLSLARIAYLLLCLEDPQAYFDLSSISMLQLLNVAMNKDQARRVFFHPLGLLLSRSPWFKDKIKSEITDLSTAIRLDKQVELVSGHSEVAHFEGLSLMAAILDEISGFPTESQKASRGIVESERTAEFIYDTVYTSASSRFPRNFKVAAISFPRYLNDPIQNLCAKAERDIAEIGIEKSIYYVDGPKASWDVNPRLGVENKIAIPETEVLVPESFAKHYREDAVMSRAKYECKPQRAVNSFFRNEGALISAFPRPENPDGWQEPLTIEYYWGIDAEGAKQEGSAELATVPGWNTLYTFSQDLKPMEGAVYAIHADLAIKGDRAGIAMCHVRNWERREFQRGKKHLGDYQEDDRPIVKVDFAACYEADLQAVVDGELRPREIQIRWFRNLVRELKRRGFTIGAITLDSFASEDTIQIFNLWGLPSENFSVDRTPVPYTTLRELIYDGRLEGYWNELLYTELEGLNKMPNGKIDHMPGASKDVSDALCGAANNAILIGGDEGEAPEEVDLDVNSVYEVGTNYTSDPFWSDVDMYSDFSALDTPLYL